MRLLFFSNVFPSPLMPGKGVFNFGLVRALVELGHQVEVVAPIAWTDHWRASTERSRRLAECRGEWQGVRVSYPIYFYTPGLLRFAYDYFMWRGVRTELRQAIKRLGPDAIVAYWAHPDGACAIRAAREAGIPAVVISGGSDVLLLTANRSRRRAIERVLADANAVVAVSEDLRQRLIALGTPADKVHVVRRGVDLARFHPDDRGRARERLGLDDARPVLLWVGRVEPVKGLNVLLAALAQLQNQGVAFRMLLLGAGGQAEVLQATTQALGITANVEWRGAVSHELLADYYRAADLTVLPSLSEGVPNVLLESIACGTPFVASSVGGVPEIATAGVDRLVPPNDPSALATAIREQLQSGNHAALRQFLPDDSPAAGQRLVEVIQTALKSDPNHCESSSACLQQAIA